MKRYASILSLGRFSLAVVFFFLSREIREAPVEILKEFVFEAAHRLRNVPESAQMRAPAWSFLSYCNLYRGRCRYDVGLGQGFFRDKGRFRAAV